MAVKRSIQGRKSAKELAQQCIALEHEINASHDIQEVDTLIDYFHGRNMLRNSLQVSSKDETVIRGTMPAIVTLKFEPPRTTAPSSWSDTELILLNKRNAHVQNPQKTYEFSSPALLVKIPRLTIKVTKSGMRRQVLKDPVDIKERLGARERVVTPLDLFSVVVFQGNLTSEPHFVTYFRCGPKAWYLYDDLNPDQMVRFGNLRLAKLHNKGELLKRSVLAVYA